MTLAQIVEKPITVATEEAISNFADSRQGRLAKPLRRPKAILCTPEPLDAPGIIAACLSGDNGLLIG
jgi:hypothetical protein